MEWQNFNKKYGRLVNNNSSENSAFWPKKSTFQPKRYLSVFIFSIRIRPLHSKLLKIKYLFHFQGGVCSKKGILCKFCATHVDQGRDSPSHWSKLSTECCYWLLLAVPVSCLKIFSKLSIYVNCKFTTTLRFLKANNV
jgi:hypothetical protein